MIDKHVLFAFVGELTFLFDYNLVIWAWYIKFACGMHVWA
jgi:hypothetical protein